MEFLVTMTTRVPEGTADAAVDEIRAREAAHSRGLARRGRLLRLWRPPLRPGEWRTLGLFAAADGGELETVLAAMPLRIWRSDDVTPLLPHPNDPGPRAAARAARMAPEFLTEFTVMIPPDGPDDAYTEAEAGEARRTRELAEQGYLQRLWALTAEPGTLHAYGLWQAEDADEMHDVLETLPLDAWMTVRTTPLSQHPNDPALADG